MKKGDFLLVYGTLRIGEVNDLEKKSRRGSVQHIGQDKINGLIYHLGWFPGLKAEPGSFDRKAPTVTGDVFELLEDEVVPMLDAYEDYPRLYNRIEVETEKGRIVWVYTFNGVVNEHELLECGDWTERPRACPPPLQATG